MEKKGLRGSKGVRGIQRLAWAEPESLGPAIYQLYVIEVVDPLGKSRYSFYVGSTRQSPEKRARAHKEMTLWGSKLFKIDGVSPGALRVDLTKDLPRFRCEACAKAAEGRLARVIKAQLGPAYSDRPDDRSKQAVEKCEGSP